MIDSTYAWSSVAHEQAGRSRNARPAARTAEVDVSQCGRLDGGKCSIGYKPKGRACPVDCPQAIYRRRR